MSNNDNTPAGQQRVIMRGQTRVIGTPRRPREPSGNIETRQARPADGQARVSTQPATPRRPVPPAPPVELTRAPRPLGRGVEGLFDTSERVAPPEGLPTGQAAKGVRQRLDELEATQAALQAEQAQLIARFEEVKALHADVVRMLTLPPLPRVEQPETDTERPPAAEEPPHAVD